MPAYTLSVTFEVDKEVSTDVLVRETNQILQHHRDEVGFNLQVEDSFVEGIIVETASSTE